MPEAVVVHSDPEIMSGTPVFLGTGVPAQALLDHLEDGDTLDAFLEGYLSVIREQAVAFLERGALSLFAASRQAAC